MCIRDRIKGKGIEVLFWPSLSPIVANGDQFETTSKYSKNIFMIPIHQDIKMEDIAKYAKKYKKSSNSMMVDVYKRQPENLDRDAAGDRKRPSLHNIPADIQQTECKFWRRNNELSTYGNLAVFGTNFYEYYQLDESESPVDVIGSVSLPLESGKPYELRIPFPRTCLLYTSRCV